MKEFPFLKHEWRRVTEASSILTDAVRMSDDLLIETNRRTLHIEIRRLIKKYGRHPVLQETLADFTTDPSRRVRLYRSAIKVAKRCHLPSGTIEMSLARVLAEDFSDFGEALRLLDECKPFVFGSDDDFEKNEWRDIESVCRRKFSDSGSALIPPNEPHQEATRSDTASEVGEPRE